MSLCVCDNDDDEEEKERDTEDGDDDNNDDNDVIWCYTRLIGTSNLIENAQISKSVNKSKSRNEKKW